MEGIKVPGLGSCCFFIPLREGLLAFKYIRFVYHMSLLVMGLALYGALILIFNGIYGFDHLFCIPLLLLFASVAYNVVAIAAAHLNNVKMIKNAILFGTVLWVITIPFSIYLCYVIIAYESPSAFTWELTVVGLEPLMQGYGLLLIHSLKLKLRAEGTFDYIDMDKHVQA